MTVMEKDKEEWGEKVIKSQKKHVMSWKNLKQ